ncbi:hypothetical protein CDAR_47761 [Caerostris darwini]|uniref:Uncharacterized protein n=1 Tax=Caerostris darwini TaxID=1538125 RepID=A0AAV4MCZ0_9ARAC|nr:hypothetical protein CDAR_47761 [Caerostris darwini]
MLVLGRYPTYFLSQRPNASIVCCPPYPCYFLMTSNRTNFNAHVQTNCGAVDVCLGRVLYKVIYSVTRPLSQLFHTLSACLQAHCSYTVVCSSYAAYHMNEEMFTLIPSAVVQSTT